VVGGRSVPEGAKTATKESKSLGLRLQLLRGVLRVLRLHGSPPKATQASQLQESGAARRVRTGQAGDENLESAGRVGNRPGEGRSSDRRAGGGHARQLELCLQPAGRRIVTRHARPPGLKRATIRNITLKNIDLKLANPKVKLGKVEGLKVEDVKVNGEVFDPAASR
jgi:hypothetical protein